MNKRIRKALKEHLNNKTFKVSRLREEAITTKKTIASLNSHSYQKVIDEAKELKENKEKLKLVNRVKTAPSVRNLDLILRTISGREVDLQEELGYYDNDHDFDEHGHMDDPFGNYDDDGPEDMYGDESYDDMYSDVGYEDEYVEDYDQYFNQDAHLIANPIENEDNNLTHEVDAINESLDSPVLNTFENNENQEQLGYNNELEGFNEEEEDSDEDEMNNVD